MRHEDYPKLILRTTGSVMENVEEFLPPDMRRGILESERKKKIADRLIDALGIRHQSGSRGLPQNLGQESSNSNNGDTMPSGFFLIPGHIHDLASELFNQLPIERVMDNDESIEWLKATVDQAQDNDPNKAGQLFMLANTLKFRFDRLGNITDIDNAIGHLQAAIDVTPDSDPQKTEYLDSLGDTLFDRFRRLGNAADIDAAVAHKQAAVKLTPDGHPHKHRQLNELGIYLVARFQRLGDSADIERAIVLQQTSVNLIPDSHPDKYEVLGNLGASFNARFGYFGNIVDVDRAIAHQQAANNLIPNGHPNKGCILNSLGNSLRSRFERFGKIADIDQAITQHHEAVKITPENHHEKFLPLSNLGTSLFCRFRGVKNLVDLNDAIRYQQAALDAAPDDHYARARLLDELGRSLLIRFRETGNIEDIESSISYTQAGVNLIPSNHPDRPRFLGNLGGSLQTHFERVGSVESIDRAIVLQNEAVRITTDGYPEKAINMLNLGNALEQRFLRFHHSEDAEAAICHFSAAAKYPMGAPKIRYTAVLSWIFLAGPLDHPSLLAAYECALDLMQIVAWIGLSMEDRHKKLIQMSGLARDAAAFAISLDQYDKALEWLEQGRSIVWNQILQLRTPVDELRSVDSDLASRLLKVSRQLDHGVEHKRDGGPIEEHGQRYRALANEWGSIIEQVRSLPNFEDFLRPPKVSRLLNAAHNGPVVVLSIAMRRCDALALIPGLEEVVHIPLPNITWQRITELRDELKDFLYSNGMRMRGQRAAKIVGDEGVEDCGSILSELWSGLVKPVLDSLAFTVQRTILYINLNLLMFCLQANPDIFPRIWWCATGPLAFLPLHAAGLYNTEAAEPQIGDYVISSYTPTVSALLGTATRTTDPPFRLLSVIQPSAPGASSIPNTRQELEYIQNRIANRDHVVLNGYEGTKQRVMKGMLNSSWLHLACHGAQRQDEPTKSGLILQDGHLTLEEIIKLDLPKAEFAFLSACQTTTGDEELSDEAVHIAAGMLLAGYRGVVATMWSIQDDLAPEVADEFYRYMMEDEGRPDNRKAAEALHYSIQKLRKKGGIPLTSWIPWVHLGA
jgi:tetratricopeptide (TPR) repeat protein